MTRLLAALGLIGLLTACGVDGEPIPPKVSGEQVIGINSNSGPFTKTNVGISWDLGG